MLVTRTNRAGVPGGGLGVALFLIAWFALLAGAASMPPLPGAEALVAQFGPGIICHAGDPQPAPPTAPVDHRDHSCPLCPLCAAHAQAVLLLPQPTPASVTPVVLATSVVSWLPPAIGPPASPVHNARPRAPPFLT